MMTSTRLFSAVIQSIPTRMPIRYRKIWHVELKSLNGLRHSTVGGDVGGGDGDGDDDDGGGIAVGGTAAGDTRDIRTILFVIAFRIFHIPQSRYGMTRSIIWGCLKISNIQ